MNLLAIYYLFFSGLRLGLSIANIKKNRKHNDNLIKRHLRFCGGKNRRKYVSKHLLPWSASISMLLSRAAAGKSHPTLLWGWQWELGTVFDFICHYCDCSPLFALFSTIQIRNYSILFAVRYSVFPSIFQTPKGNSSNRRKKPKWILTKEIRCQIVFIYFEYKRSKRFSYGFQSRA